MKRILGKSDNTTLLDHSILVSLIAVEMAKKVLKKLDPVLIEAIRVSSLLHDIAKSTIWFQKLFKNGEFDEDIIGKKYKYRHNEVGWAFLLDNVNLPSDIKEYVLDGTYWHHGITNKMGGYSNLDIVISEDDKKLMREQIVLLLGEEYLKDDCCSEMAPQYYSSNPEINEKKMFIRMCVISADRLASKHDFNGVDISEFINNLSKLSHKVDLESHTYFLGDRYNNQIDIAKKAHEVTTSLIKAPCGFGKTLLGLIWMILSDEKILWVCPRNVVAKNVWESIIKDLNGFTDHKISVQLVLGNEVIKTNNEDIPDFEADIIITNIDSYLSPTINNTFSSRLFTIYSRNVIFDEQHELVSDSAIFDCFVSIMKVRHRKCNSKTLLLSATPNLVHILWDGIDNKTQILPSKDSHYNAQHDKKYLIRVIDGDIITDTPKENNLIIYNAISNSQINMNNHRCDIIYHSGFVEEDSDRLLNELLTKFVNDGTTKLGVGDVISTLKSRTSLDATFGHYYESVLNPESTLQGGGGRCNRGGHYEHTPTINIFRLVDKSETMVKSILYSVPLSDKWFYYLLPYHNTFMTLNELYVIYNEYYKLNEKELMRYLNVKLLNSRRNLAKIYPTKFSGVKKTNVKTAGSNKLRSTENDEVFYICKIYNSDEYSEPISTQIYTDFDKEFKESGNILNTLKKHIKSLTKDPRFSYSEIDLKYITLDGLRNLAKKSDKPYIALDRVYHKTYGVIKINLLKNLLG